MENAPCKAVLSSRNVIAKGQDQQWAFLNRLPKRPSSATLTPQRPTVTGSLRSSPNANKPWLATRQAKESALSSDDAGLDAAEASLRAAQDRAATLKTALTEMNQQLADLERAKEDAADKKLRAETAAEIDRLVGKLTDVGAEFNNSAARLSEHAARAVPLVYDALGLDKFVATCLVGVLAALELVTKLLCAHADAVIAGTAPGTLPRGDDQHVPPPAQAPAEPHFKYPP
ncbi:hypothetical protein MTX25_34340 [Bradyrhizobium sp. ISRA432]|uniref:hypothetical protein n=1 Tax=Bradyrhizobium sp. ISRA430 TaxID=2866192 RepID=UPI00247B1377|nr:hypothetical protein [Bradyrhizobium sp. ISRA430]WGR82507.1 hypothetical protein MTX21_19760 [Bradyrhizobium sp. ISRA430]WGR85693.1 hypothetical protein MTX25_34340 [Bradyrhizobium sp. ISRA432]